MMAALSQPAEVAFASRSSAVRASQREMDDNYGWVVAVLNEQWLVIEGSCGL